MCFSPLPPTLLLLLFFAPIELPPSSRNVIARYHVLYLVVGIAVKPATGTWKRRHVILLQRAVHDRENHKAQSHMVVVGRKLLEA